MSKFLTILKRVISEELGDDQQEAILGKQEAPNADSSVAPVETSDSSSALPDKEDVNGIDLIKYKTLLKSLQDSLVKSVKNDKDEYTISKLDIDSKNTREELQPIEDTLMAFLHDKEVPSNSDWSDT